MLRLIRRHTKDCRFSSTRYRRCPCPIHVYGTLGGEKIRRALDLTSWEAASELVNGWTAAGQLGVVNEEIPTIDEAVRKFLLDAESRHLSHETIRKYKNLLEKRLLAWCDETGRRTLKQLTVNAVRDFRISWRDGSLYATKNLERRRAFFAFCKPWMKENPALALKAPQVEVNPTLPFTAEEMSRILDACQRYRGDKARIEAFVLVMRYSGLRISDTISLRCDQLRDGKIRLYTAKTGQPVSVPVPGVVTEALAKVVPAGERYFWSGHGKLTTPVSNWSRYLDSVFRLAGVDGGRSHRFRDTFAVSLLAKGVALETVSILLGHASIRITEKHYRPWVRSLQEKFEADVQKAWSA